ncbi:amidase [Rhodococcus sp. IEGM 1408]|uniref:amidase n=1 Tax=Rhodococcus sp. IEGM 1408 TaxID=3082220 RepID=UPI002953CC16|nr:amidase [Rhodococcus sp. IEGM 1408]MDV8001402.1 amidase [Rhodococcus sp. IEGM 1408]
MTRHLDLPTTHNRADTVRPAAVGRRDALALAADIRSGATDPTEVLERAIDRIETLDPQLNAVVSTRFDDARAEIAVGLPGGPLRGVPIVIKNLGTDVAGQPATDGSRLFADVVATVDSAIVQRYKAAGMLVLGTTNVPEMGKTTTTESLLYGPCRNPWNPDYSTGGSSGGSAAAVASGMVPVAHATDGGGSIRIPAAMCGLVGLKPSRGRVPTWPHPAALAAPIAYHHAVTATVRDSAALLDVVAGHVPGDAYGAPTPARPFLAEAGTDPGHLRIGVMRTAPGPFPTDPDCSAAVDRTASLLDGLGHEVIEVELGIDVIEVMVAIGDIMGAQLQAKVEDRLTHLGRELREDDLEPWTRRILENSLSLTAPRLSRALETAQRTGWRVAELFAAAGVDALLLPTMPVTTPELGFLDVTDPESMWTRSSMFSAATSLFNLSGQPAISLPLGTDGRGLPVGVQLVADYAREDLLLRLSGQLEAAAPWLTVAPGFDGW